LIKKIFYVPWDIVDSSIEVLFTQFQTFYAINKSEYFPAKEALAKYWKGDEWNYFTLAQRQKHVAYLEMLEEAYNQLHEIDKYLDVVRNANQQLVDCIYDEMFDSCDFNKEEIFKITDEVKHFKIKFHFSEFNHLIIDEKKVSKVWCEDILNLERALLDKDTEIATSILKYRLLLAA
jgi:hypothetical protein